MCKLNRPVHPDSVVNVKQIGWDTQTLSRDSFYSVYLTVCSEQLHGSVKVILYGLQCLQQYVVVIYKLSIFYILRCVLYSVFSFVTCSLGHYLH